MTDQPSDSGHPSPTLREVKAAGGRWGLDEFVEVVNSLVERYLPASRGFNVKLRDAFNPRLVRYYATFGLISPPEREGKEARYHYGHLLQALVIRRLLFEGYTAPILLKVLAGKTEADYEGMLAGGVSTSAASIPGEEMAGYSAPGTPGQQHLVRELMAAAPAPPAPPAPPAGSPLPALPPPVPTTHVDSILWRRKEIAPGLELHIRADFPVPGTRVNRESLLLAVLEALQNRA